MASRKQDAAEAEPTVEADEAEQPVDDAPAVDQSDWPRNEFGTLLNPDDGQPVFNTVTGESRQQYLARKFDEDKATLLDDLAASIAADQPEPTSTPDTKE